MRSGGRARFSWGAASKIMHTIGYDMDVVRWYSGLLQRRANAFRRFAGTVKCGDVVMHLESPCVFGLKERSFAKTHHVTCKLPVSGMKKRHRAGRWRDFSFS